MSSAPDGLPRQYRSCKSTTQRLTDSSHSIGPGQLSWITMILKRSRAEAEAAFEPRSRPAHQPHPAGAVHRRSDHRTAGHLVGQRLDHGPHTIGWHLEHHTGWWCRRVDPPTSPGGRADHPTPQKRPKSSYIRFAAEQPNERWQADFTHWWLADPTYVEILDWLDDHARYALSVTAPCHRTHRPRRSSKPMKHMAFRPPP